MSQKILSFFHTKRTRLIIIFTIPIALLLFVIFCSVITVVGQQFSALAYAFLHGHLNFLSSIGGKGQDPVIYHGRIYWDDGPFPSVVLLPFIATFDLFNRSFFQGYLQWALILGVLFFVYKLARKLAYSLEDSLLLGLGFVLASVFIGVASISSSWHFSQVLTTFLLLWSLYEFYTHKRWWLIGTICGFIFLTRATAAPIIIFFGLEFIGLHKEQINKVKKLIILFAPLLVAIILQGMYNFIRFHYPLNGGYEYQLITPDSAEARSMGIFSLSHIPTNLYSMILRAPIPVLKDSVSWTLKYPYIKNNTYGMSIFFTSPYLLWIFTNKWSKFDKQTKHLIVAILISALLVLSYYGIGLYAYGDRYTLDFMPELFLLFMILYRKSHDRLTFGMRTLIIGSTIFNFYLLLSYI